MIFIKITMLDRPDLLGHFEIMDFVKGLVSRIATLAVLHLLRRMTSSRSAGPKQQRT
jgi:hypothetical protein